MDFVSSTHPEKFAVILDLQERAYQAVTEYVTKASTQPVITESEMKGERRGRGGREGRRGEEGGAIFTVNNETFRIPCGAIFTWARKK